MKKLLTTIVIMATIFTFGISFASAQTTTLHPSEILPDTIDLYYEFSTINKNPLEEMILGELTNNLGLFSDSEEAKDIILKLLADNTLTLGMNIESDMDFMSETPEMYASFYVNEENFNFLLDTISDVISKTEYNGKTIYTTSEIDNFVYLDNLVITTNLVESAQLLIDNYNNKSSATLANLQTYKNSRAHDLSSSFLFVYVNPSFIADNSFDELSKSNSTMFVDIQDIDSNLISALIGEGFSLAQTENGFDYSVYVEGDETKLKALNLLFNKFNFVPELYKNISGNDVILYTEQFNLAKSIEDSLAVFNEDSELITAYKEFTVWFNEISDLNFENDALPLLEGRYLVTMHDTDQIIPAVTLIFESKANYATTIKLLSELSNFLKTTWEGHEKETGQEFYSYSITTAGGASFYTHEFDLSAGMGEDSIGPNQKLKISYTLDGNKLVISTHPNLDSIYKKDGGMTSNDNFDRLYTNRSDSINHLVYFDMDSLRSYLNTLFVASNAPEDVITIMEGFLSPWHSLYGITYSTPATTWATGELQVDVDELAEYGNLLDEFFYNQNYDFEYPEILPLFDATKYCDISVNDWYYEYVNDLTSTGIVGGYEDGCFGPNNEVTRAEFTKMVLGGAEWSGLYVPVAMSDQDIYFSDVPSDQWYWHYVNQAAANDYVNGYNDETFHPNSPISRSEAVQILYNASPYLQSFTGYEPFNDVSEEDWYFNAVSAAYSAGIVNGTSISTFEPNRNITRAEASKIVNTFMYLY